MAEPTKMDTIPHYHFPEIKKLSPEFLDSIKKKQQPQGEYMMKYSLPKMSKDGITQNLDSLLKSGKITQEQYNEMQKILKAY